LSVTGAIAQYKNVYTKGSPDDQLTNYGLAINFKGDAVYETSNNINGADSWFGDYSYMPGNVCPWFVRGGYWGSGPAIFGFGGTWVTEGSGIGFRPVLLVGTGL
jgi:hypothetical protein